MKNFIKIITLIILFFTSACSGGLDSVKRGLSGQKTGSTDEFLVKKKDPLVLPPKFNQLPKPGLKEDTKVINEEKNIADILKVDNKSTTASESSGGSLEQTILKNINKN